MSFFKPTALWAAGIATCLLAGAPARAETRPRRSISLVVPFPAGGGADTLARLMSEPLMRDLGQTIVIENRPGAGGNIGSATASRAEPNGYTLAYATNGTQAINHWLYKNTGFSRDDFEPISRLTTIAAAVVVNPDEPYQSLKDLLDAARAKPGMLTCGSAGNGTTSHLACEQLKQMTGVDIVHVPYKGGAAAMTDLMGGRLSLLIDVMPNVAQQIKAKRLRALAVTTNERVASNPDIPTVAEAGVPGYSFFAWDALYAPKGTPPAVLDRVNAAVHKVLAEPALRAQLEERGAQPAPTTREGLKTFSNEEYERLGKVVRTAGAVID
ncbi:tripartite tricarboxylate transporter substrate binding protein [Bordetella avium]|uniref:Bug family tripartite tricarboxylate transporter substrate binding protein n=1 Tax=Bordetella avium TaxID=521 RepID=UPI00307DC5B0